MEKDFGYQLILSAATLLVSLLVLFWSATGKSPFKQPQSRPVFYLAAPVALAAMFSSWLAWGMIDRSRLIAGAMLICVVLAFVSLVAALSFSLSGVTRLLEHERRSSDHSRTFQTLFNITRGGLILVDSSGRLLNVNPSCIPLFGYGQAQLLSMQINDIVDLSTTGLSGCLGLVDDQQGSGVVEAVCKRKDGQVLHLQLTSALIPQSGGQLFVILRDITERKHAEEIRARLEAQLRHSQKLEAIGTLASGIAHDFNNILSAILGNIELARQEIDKNSPALASMLEIRKAGQRAKELVGRIVGFARPRDNKMRASHLQPVIEDAVKLVRATLPAGVEIDCRFAPDLPHVKIDDSQLSQLLLNLCTNSFQAFAQGKGNIVISADVRDLSVDHTAQNVNLRAGKYVCLRVHDTGSGIDPAIAERIFEPFFTTKPRGEGTGLGLSIVHTIVRGHGGAITFDSKPGEGTTFEVWLPAVMVSENAAAVEIVAPTPSATPQGSRQHILYVDDEEPLVFLTTRLLERQGYRVTGYTNPKTALKEFLANSDDFDLFITDQSMPGMYGTDLAREILRVKPDTQIILVSGYLRPDEIELARSIGIREVILKPNSVDELAAAVQRIISGGK